jgi:hypothetical protein
MLSFDYCGAGLGRMRLHLFDFTNGATYLWFFLLQKSQKIFLGENQSTHSPLCSHPFSHKVPSDSSQLTLRSPCLFLANKQLLVVLNRLCADVFARHRCPFQLPLVRLSNHVQLRPNQLDHFLSHRLLPDQRAPHLLMLDIRLLNRSLQLLSTHLFAFKPLLKQLIQANLFC